MSSRLKRVVKAALRPLRESLGRFALPPSGVNKSSIAYCAGALIAAEKIEGDYLEFGVFPGRLLPIGVPGDRAGFSQRIDSWGLESRKGLRRETAAVEPDALLRLRLLRRPSVPYRRRSADTGFRPQEIPVLTGRVHRESSQGRIASGTCEGRPGLVRRGPKPADHRPF